MDVIEATGLSSTYLSPLIYPRPDSRIAQQSHRRRNEGQHYYLVFCRVSLEASREDVLLLFALAEAVAQAELAVAVIARLLACAGAQFEVRLGGRPGAVESDNGTVTEACAFAEGCRCWGC